MNRETEQHFANIPDITISRSKLVRPYTLWDTMNAADLVPIYVDSDIMPGDTVKMQMSSVIRMMTPLVPVMDNCYADITFFFVPHRLVWDHWENFWGQNDTAPWIQQVEYTTPMIKAPATTGWEEKSLADKLGYPLNAPEVEVSALPLRAYCKIYNDFWRDENWKNPVNFTTGDDTVIGTNPSDYTDENPYDYVTDTETAAMCLKAAKPHDYFTSVLPSAQKGPEVYIPLGESAPVWGQATEIGVTEESLVGKNLTLYMNEHSQFGITAGADQNLTAAHTIGLYTDLSNAVGATIGQLRQAYSIQRFYEALARGGSRYIEMIRSIYGVTNPDFRLQRAEYLGGFRLPINVNQVLQSDAGASDATPLGHTGAYSLTADARDDVFTHSFTEHGTLMGLITIRHEHSYGQGCPRMFTRKKIFDYYTPQLANLSEQAVLAKEIYCDGTSDDENAWGYQEAWAEYRYFPNQVHGEIRASYAQSLSVWTYQDYYEERPTMGDKWIDESDVEIQNTLAVQNHDQFFANYYFKPIYIRPMPVYSVPGLTGHM